MIFLLIIGFGALCFGMGYIVGDTFGWDRCWRDLTKDDNWRKERAR